jgi:hypothetical protein
MGLVASDAADEASPTLWRDHHDTVFVAYHSDGDDIRMWRTEDYGEEWTDHLNRTDGTFRYPRAAWVPGFGLYYVVYDMVLGGLRLYHSPDYGTTNTGVYSITSVPEQLAGLRCDRRGVLHLIYQDGSNSCKVLSSNDPGTTAGGGDWPDLTALSLAVTSADLIAPNLAVGQERGFFGFFGSNLASSKTLYSTIEPHNGLDTEIDFDFPFDFEPAKHMGVLVDRREWWWLAAVEATTKAIKIYYSADKGETWAELAEA